MRGLRDQCVGKQMKECWEQTASGISEVLLYITLKVAKQKVHCGRRRSIRD